MADLHIKIQKCFIMHGFHLIGNHIFCTYRLIRFQYAVLHYNCCSPSIKFKPFPMNIWRNWHLFKYQKRPNRIKKSYRFLQVANWSLIFLQIFFWIFISYPQWNIVRWVLALQLYLFYKNAQMIPPLQYKLIIKAL